MCYIYKACIQVHANLKAKIVVCGGSLDVKDAEQFWVKEVQRELKPVENYKTLCPFMSEGIIYVGGRTSNQRLLYETEYQELLPAGHHVSLLITRHMHEVGHYGVAKTAAKMRRQFGQEYLGSDVFAANVRAYDRGTMDCGFSRLESETIFTSVPFHSDRLLWTLWWEDRQKQNKKKEYIPLKAIQYYIIISNQWSIMILFVIWCYETRG